MVSFSKPVQASSSVENIPAKRKRIPNSKLTDENNVDKEAIKRRKQEATQQGKNPKPRASTENQTITGAAVEDTDTDDDSDIYMPRNDGQPKSTSADLEAGNGTDATEVIDLEDEDPVIVMDEEEEAGNDMETAEKELGIVKIQSWNCFINSFFRTTSKRMALTDLCIF